MMQPFIMDRFKGTRSGFPYTKPSHGREPISSMSTCFANKHVVPFSIGLGLAAKIQTIESAVNFDFAFF